MDSNGDGIGDLRGLISKLDYLQELGIGIIWICPIYKSPNDDNGYDVSDYQDIMDEFGTMKDFDELLKEVHARGMRLIMDLVVNHTSDEHPWFIESRSSLDNPKRDYYIWADPKDGREPNNWASLFGGSIWEYDEHTGQYFMHVFSRRQPDLNWENPEMRREIYEMINWWLEKGIDGFRVDAISHIKKTAGFPDMPGSGKSRYLPSEAGHMNREGIHELLSELKQQTFDKHDIMTVGEASGVEASEAEHWVGEARGKFNMIFQFEHMGLWQKSLNNGLDLPRLKQVLTKWQKELEGTGWNALFLENHDQPRSVSTWGNDSRFRNESAKALATMYFLMQGTPFIYQGQEIGMTNVQFPSIEDYDDVSMKNWYRIERENGKRHEEIMPVIWKNGRDNSRTPMQWNSNPQAGFTTGTPWMKVNPNYVDINVESSLRNPNSIYYYFKDLIALRKAHAAAIYGSYDLLLAEDTQIYAYTRTLDGERLLIITNLSVSPAIFTISSELLNREMKADLLLVNYGEQAQDGIELQDLLQLPLRPYEARVYRLSV